MGLIIKSEKCFLFSKSSIEIIYNPKRPIFNYSESLKNIYNEYIDYSHFTMQANKDINNNTFIKWLETNNYDYNVDKLKEDWTLIKNRIIAELSNKIFNRNYYYKTIIMNDKTVLEALNYFDEAKTLLN